MLRTLFGEPPRVAEGQLKEAIQSMERFLSLLQHFPQGRDQDQKRRKAEIWTRGLIRSLDELEQSHYASVRYADQIKYTGLNEMSEADRTSYSLHIYYDKNAFIRLFALLDKLGTLMNEWFDLHTERIKPHFSYFTVLRNMRQRNIHPKLTASLNELKEKYKEPMSRLRTRRNTEIHYMNSEMQDDLVRLLRTGMNDMRLENIKDQLDDMQNGLDMATGTLKLTFEFACRRMSKTR